jgi:hypothetical protein
MHVVRNMATVSSGVVDEAALWVGASRVCIKDFFLMKDTSLSGHDQIQCALCSKRSGTNKSTVVLHLLLSHETSSFKISSVF